MKWTETKSKTQTEYFAKDGSRSAKERPACIDEFLNGALHRIGDAYNYKNCPAILFDLIHNGAVRVFDLPDGPKLSHNEKVWCQLIHTKYSQHLWDTLDTISNNHGNDSPEFNAAGRNFYQQTTEAITQSLSRGEASMLLKKYSPAPLAIVIIDGFDGEAQNVITGKSIAFNGNRIEN